MNHVPGSNPRDDKDFVVLLRHGVVASKDSPRVIATWLVCMSSLLLEKDSPQNFEPVPRVLPSSHYRQTANNQGDVEAAHCFRLYIKVRDSHLRIRI